MSEELKGKKVDNISQIMYFAISGDALNICDKYQVLKNRTAIK